VQTPRWLTPTDFGSASSNILKQLDFFWRNQVELKWPDVNSLQFTMEGMFDRLKHVRDLNKKNFQRRAFIDLLKFMKDQGLRANFQDKILPYLLNAELIQTNEEGLDGKLSLYFYKS
jgi:hypothetical protein